MVTSTWNANLVLLVTTLLLAGLVEEATSQATAGVPATPNVGNGQATATIPSGLGGLSTGVTITFTPGAAVTINGTPYSAPTDAAGSASLASILTHYSQGMTAATPTTGPPTGISTGITGGFTGTGTSSVLDGQVTTIPNAATTYTGPRSSSSASASAGASNAANSLNSFHSDALTSTLLCSLAIFLTACFAL